MLRFYRLRAKRHGVRSVMRDLSSTLGKLLNGTKSESFAQETKIKFRYLHELHCQLIKLNSQIESCVPVDKVGHEFGQEFVQNSDITLKYYAVCEQFMNQHATLHNKPSQNQDAEAASADPRRDVNNAVPGATERSDEAANEDDDEGEFYDGEDGDEDYADEGIFQLFDNLFL